MLTSPTISHMAAPGVARSAATTGLPAPVATGWQGDFARLVHGRSSEHVAPETDSPEQTDGPRSPPDDREIREAAGPGVLSLSAPAGPRDGATLPPGDMDVGSLPASLPDVSAAAVPSSSGRAMQGLTSPAGEISAAADTGRGPCSPMDLSPAEPDSFPWLGKETVPDVMRRPDHGSQEGDAMGVPSSDLRHATGAVREPAMSSPSVSVAQDMPVSSGGGPEPGQAGRRGGRGEEGTPTRGERTRPGAGGRSAETEAPTAQSPSPRAEAPRATGLLPAGSAPTLPEKERSRASALVASPPAPPGAPTSTMTTGPGLGAAFDPAQDTSPARPLHDAPTTPPPRTEPASLQSSDAWALSANRRDGAASVPRFPVPLAPGSGRPIPEPTPALLSLEAEAFAPGPIGAESTQLAVSPRGLPPPMSHAPPVLQQLAAAVRSSGTGVTEIWLEPVELGRVMLTLSSGESGITVMVAADRPETVDLIRRHLDSLSAELRQIGFGSVTCGFAQSGSGRDEDRSGGPTGRAIDAPEPAEDHFPADGPRGAIAGDGALDIRM